MRCGCGSCPETTVLRPGAAGELQRAPKQPEWPPPTLKLADLLDLTNLARLNGKTRIGESVIPRRG